MSLYYILITDDYQGKQEDIGDIMCDFSNSLHKQTGLSIGIYCGPMHEDLDTWVQGQNLEPIMLEELLWKNMTDGEKVIKFTEYISNIGGINGDLLIIDPYIFPQKYDANYIGLVTSILKMSKFKSLKVVTDNAKFNKNLFDRINSQFNNNIDVVFSNEFHDRFWIANKSKGFLVGSSLNGIGKKISVINYIEDNKDIEAIVDIIKSIKEDNN